MTSTEWQSLSSSSSRNTEYGFICMSTTVDDLSYTPSEQERSRDAAQIVATGRRSWKTLKGKGEAVWPPLLEAALLEALGKYQPEVVGTKAKSLGRFPMRNRFISDYIFEITGKRRTPKQVGSRLQQLRDTCKGDKILHLISHRSTPEPTSTDSPSEYSHPTTSPSPPPDNLTSSQSSIWVPRSPKQAPEPPKQVFVFAEISLQQEIWPAITTVPSIHLADNSPSSPQKIQLSPSLCSPNASFLQGKPNCLSFLSGLMQFTSSCVLSPRSTFTVYANGSNTPLHTEVVSLTCVSSPMQRSGWLYSSDLVPGFWDRLCFVQDLSRYRILQSFTSVQANSSSHLDSTEPNGNISVVYKFAPPPRVSYRRQLERHSRSSRYNPPYPKSTTPVQPILHNSLPNIYSGEWQQATPASAAQVLDCSEDRLWKPFLNFNYSNDVALNDFSFGIPFSSGTPALSVPRDLRIDQVHRLSNDVGLCSNGLSVGPYTSMTQSQTPGFWPSDASIYPQRGFSYS